MNNKQQILLLPMAALVGNALIWGLIWWPLRALHGHGWHPLWSTMIVFLLATVGLLLRNPEAFSYLRRSPVLWIVGIASGVTNGAFNWGMAIGDVVRVILLFYLMPIWAVLLARLLLKEAITAVAVVRILLALAGAALVLKPEAGGLPVPSGLGDWLGVIGGMGFALTNVMLRRAADQPSDGRAMAMFLAGFLIPGVVAVGLTAASAIDLPTSLHPNVLLLLIGLGLVMLVANIALQYGAVRLPVNVTAVIMLTEVLFAALSSVLIDGTVLTGWMFAGGALILTASSLAVFERKKRLAPLPQQSLNP